MTRNNLKLITLVFIALLILIIVGGFCLGSAVFDMVILARGDVIHELKTCVTGEEDHQKELRELASKQQQEKAEVLITGYMMTKNKKLALSTALKESDLVFEICKSLNVDPWQVVSWIKIESDFSTNLPPGGSGEMGAAQVTPGTFEDYKIILGLEDSDFLNWEKTLLVGITYYRDLLVESNGDIESAVGQYNAGRKEGWEKRSRGHVEKFKVVYEEILRLKDVIDYGKP
jgi:soluble lytic murein transglycosylase-like protein